MIGGFESKWSSPLRRNWPVYVVVILFFACGVLFGILGVSRLQITEVNELITYLETFLEQINRLEVYSNTAVKSALYNNMAVMVAIYVLGLTVIGIPVMLALVFARGFVLGFAFTFLVKEKSTAGIILAAASILPQNLLYVPALIVGGAASLSFALLLIRRNFNSSVRIWPGFIRYCWIMLLVTMVALGAGLVEAYFSPALLKAAANLLA